MSDQPGSPVQRRRTRAEIEQIVAEFATGGVTRTEFCRRQHIGLSTLNRYLKRQREDTSTGASDGDLVAVELAGTRSGTSGDCGCSLVVVLPRGRRIEVGAGFDGSTLQRLIIVLEEM